MMTITYRIQFFEYWHSSSGLAAGTNTNLSVRKTRAGLPLIPGRALKGLLNEAAYKLYSLPNDLIQQDFLEKVFGTGDDEYNKNSDLAADSDLSKASQCFFSNAELSAQLTTSLGDNAAHKSLLFTNRSSTRMDEKGIAIDNTLRTIQVTVPLTLYAKITDFPEDAHYLQQLTYCMQWIKKMGLNRTRGLGRCTFTIVEPQNLSLSNN